LSWFTAWPERTLKAMHAKTPSSICGHLWSVTLLAGCGLVSLGSGCLGGQSGSEGEIPAAPCAGQGALFQAHVLDVGAGSVRLEVDAQVKAGDPLTNGDGVEIFSGTVEPGEVLSGRLGRVYAWSHEFTSGESVAVLPGPWGELPSFELMPMEGERVIVQWTSARFESTLEELAAEDCSQRLSERVELDSDVREQ
jgi:hypothetical protein